MSVEGCPNLFQDERGVIFPPPDPAEVKRAEEQAARTAEWEAAAQRRTQEIDALCDRLDAAMEPYLQEHLAAANVKARISPAVKKDFEQFKAYCARYDPPLPHLPARPQAIAAFLVREMSHGSAHASRLVKNISTVHRAVGFSDPATDVLVQAVLRSITSEEGRRLNANL